MPERFRLSTSFALAAPWLGLQPSFFISKTSSLSFLGAHVLVDFLPSLPTPSLQTDVPLTIVHAFFRTTLLCNVIPRVVASNASPAVAASSFTLLLTAWVSGPVPSPAISPALLLIVNLDHAKWRALHFQPFLPFASDAG